MAQVSNQVRREFLAVFLGGRIISVDMQYIDMQVIKEWLRIFKCLPADKTRIGSFKIIWNRGDVDDYCSGVESHPYFDPALRGYSEHFESTLATICEAICGAGLTSAVVKHVVEKGAGVGKQDRQNFEQHAQEVFKKIELECAKEEKNQNSNAQV